MFDQNGIPEFCAPGCHEAEPVDFSHRETLWQCKLCPWFEFTYTECDGL